MAFTTFTATPDTATGSVTLSFAQVSPVTKIVRSDSNGVSEVRTSAGQLPTPATGTLIVTDYEAAAGVNNYTAYVTDTVVLTNLLTNPSAEYGTAGWTYSWGDVSVYGNTNFVGRVGSEIFQLTLLTGGASNYEQATSPAVPVVAGSWVSFSARVWGDNYNNVSERVELRYTDDAGTLIGTIYGPLTSVHFYTGGTLTVSGQVPVGATKVYAKVTALTTDSTNLPAGYRMWWDAAILLNGSTPDAVSDTAYFDGDTPDTGDAIYSWDGTAGASTSRAAITTRQITASATLHLDQPFLMVPIAPQYSALVESLTDYSAGRTTSNTVHQIIGRSDPIVTLGKLGTRTGSLDIWTDSVATANDVARVFDRGEIVMLKQNVNGLDMYFTADNLSISPYSALGEELTRYKLNVSYIEVARPFGDLAGALGWNFDELAADYASFNAVAAAFKNFDALTLQDSK